MESLTSAPSRRTDTGAAAVEFALILIILLSVIFAIINFGITFASQIGLNSAARDASRAGVVKALDPGAALSCGAVAVAARNNGGPFPPIRPRSRCPSQGQGVLRPGSRRSDTGEQRHRQQHGQAMRRGRNRNNQLLVELQFRHESLVPFVPPTTLDQKSSGRFTCEYS